MRDILLMQLAFNILILTALLVLATRGARRRKPQRKAKASAPERKKVPGRVERALKKVARLRAPAPEPARLDSLIERVERQELVAEQDLRSRLSRFKARAAG